MKIRHITLMLALAFPVIVNGQRKQSVKPMQSGNSGMSAAFRDKAQRAFDAIKRLPTVVPSAESREPGWEQRKLDVDKAIDEAKYKARTAKDEQVFRILSASGFLIGAAKERHVLDPDWQPLTEAARQCHTELTAELQAKDLSELGRKKAAEKTCLKQQDAIIKTWEERHP